VSIDKDLRQYFTSHFIAPVVSIFLEA